MTRTSGIILLSTFLSTVGCGVANDLYIPTSLKGEDRKSLFVLQGCGRAVTVDGEGPSKGLFTNFVLEPNKKYTLTFPTPNSGNMKQPTSKKEITGSAGEVKSCQNVILGR